MAFQQQDAEVVTPEVLKALIRLSTFERESKSRTRLY